MEAQFLYWRTLTSGAGRELGKSLAWVNGVNNGRLRALAHQDELPERGTSSDLIPPPRSLLQQG